MSIFRRIAMMEIKGQMNTAICFAKVIEDEAIEQIYRIIDVIRESVDVIEVLKPIYNFKAN